MLPKKLPKEKGRLGKLLLQTKIIHMEHLGRRRSTRLYVCEHKDWGCSVAIVKKKPDAVFRDGLSFAEAAEQGTMCWMLEESILPLLEHAYNVKLVIFVTEVCEDIYVSKLADWLDDTKRYVKKNLNTMTLNYHSTPLRHLAFEHFKLSPGNRSLIVR